VHLRGDFSGGDARKHDEAERVLKTAIRISTIGWMLALLSAAIAPMRARAADASSASPPSCLTVYRYDVRVAVHREATNSLPPAFAGAGTTRKVTDWKASFVAPIYLDRCAGMKLQITARPAGKSGNQSSPLELHGGQFDSTFDWNDATEQNGYTKKPDANDTTKLYVVPPCHYTFASHVQAVMYVTASFGYLTANPENIQFDFLAGRDFSDQTTNKAEIERAADAKYAVCDDHRHEAGNGYTVIGDAGMPLDGFSGMAIGDNQLHLTFGMPPNSPLKASILDALVDGKGFNYDTGLQLYQRKVGDSELSERVRATVSFSPTGRPSGSPSDSSPQPEKEPCDHTDFGMWMTYLSYCASYTQHYRPPNEEASLATMMQRLSAQHEADRKRCGYTHAPFHCGKPPDCTTQLQKVVAAGDPYKLSLTSPQPCPYPQPATPASCNYDHYSVWQTIKNNWYGWGAAQSECSHEEFEQNEQWQQQCLDWQFRQYQQTANDMRKNPQNYVSDPRCKQGQGPAG
jgi:hypothetical protein